MKVEEELARIELVLVGALNAVHAVRRQVVDREVEPVQPNLPGDLIELGVAAQLAHRPSDTVRAWCRTHPIDAGGFAMKLKARWFVSRKLFVEFLRSAR